RVRPHGPHRVPHVGHHGDGRRRRAGLQPDRGRADEPHRGRRPPRFRGRLRPGRGPERLPHRAPRRGGGTAVTPKMTRLVLAAVLFAAWMGYLGYLVYTLPKPVNNMPVVLSRPQFLVSDLDVIGDIDLKEGTVAVRKVLYSRGGNLPDFGTPIK